MHGHKLAIHSFKWTVSSVYSQEYSVLHHSKIIPGYHFQRKKWNLIRHQLKFYYTKFTVNTQFQTRYSRAFKDFLRTATTVFQGLSKALEWINTCVHNSIHTFAPSSVDCCSVILCQISLYFNKINKTLTDLISSLVMYTICSVKTAAVQYLGFANPTELDLTRFIFVNPARAKLAQLPQLSMRRMAYY